MRGLTGKVAIVTGATQTMGEAIAQRLADEGACIVGFGRSADRGRAVAERISTTGGQADFVPGDVTVDADVRVLVERTLDRHRRVDIVVNNAAAIELIRNGTETGVADVSMDVFDRQFQVGVHGALRLAQLVIPHMLRSGGGAFVTISSQGGHRAFPGMTGYAPAKAAVEALSRQIAVDYGSANIRSNCVVLGSIRVEQNEHVHDTATGARLREMQMLLDVGRPDHVAAAVAFLASDDAAFVTGVALPVDGGLLAKAPMTNAGFDEWMSRLSSATVGTTTT